MTTITFDTLKFTEQLIEAGYTEQQAKGTVRAYQAAHDGMELATKNDTKEIEYKIELLRAETKQAIAESKAELIRWVIAAGFLQTAFISALLLKVANLI